MTLLEFKTNLNDFIKENPNSLNLQVITSKDGAGNSFFPVHYSPSKGIFKGDQFNESNIKADSICINQPVNIGILPGSNPGTGSNFV